MVVFGPPKKVFSHRAILKVFRFKMCRYVVLIERRKERFEGFERNVEEKASSIGKV